MKKPVHDIPFTRSARRHWRLIILEGTLLIILGWLAIFIPPTISLAPTYILGWVFLSSGLIGLITTISGRRYPDGYVRRRGLGHGGLRSDQHSPRNRQSQIHCRRGRSCRRPLGGCTCLISIY